MGSGKSYCTLAHVANTHQHQLVKLTHKPQVSSKKDGNHVLFMAGLKKKEEEEKKRVRRTEAKMESFCDSFLPSMSSLSLCPEDSRLVIRTAQRRGVWSLGNCQKGQVGGARERSPSCSRGDRCASCRVNLLFITAFVSCKRSQEVRLRSGLTLDLLEMLVFTFQVVIIVAGRETTFSLKQNKGGSNETGHGSMLFWHRRWILMKPLNDCV